MTGGSADGQPKRRNWLFRRVGESLSTLHAVVSEPHSIGPMLRRGLVSIWRVRGGGFYGLGYLICFIVLEVRMLVGNFEGDGDIVTMLVLEVLEFVFRFTVQSFLNGLLAFIWPVFVLDALRGWGIVLIGGTWFWFDRWAKPRVEAWLPDLKNPREET